MAYGETYSMFVEKFKPKKTTDDCYTPPAVYEAVAGWVVERYGVDPATFVRPFYPGGNYEGEDYAGKVVVDNPPFSILSQIVRFYAERKIHYFLFAPTMTILQLVKDSGTALIENAQITYENGAVVNTSFVTSLTPGLIIETEPSLFEAIRKAQNAEKTPALPTYVYPPEMVTAARLNSLARNGRRLEIRRDEAAFVRSLDSQRAAGKGVFGGGLLISRAAAELAAAELAAAERAAAKRAAAKTEWSLSTREQAIIDHLNGKERKNDGYETKSKE